MVRVCQVEWTVHTEARFAGEVEERIVAQMPNGLVICANSFIEYLTVLVSPSGLWLRCVAQIWTLQRSNYRGDTREDVL